MPTDTTERTTRRPNVPEELDDRLAADTTQYVRVPADRLAFADRLEILLEEHARATDEVAALEEENDQLRAQRDELQDRVAELEEKVQQLEQSAQGGVLSRSTR